MSYQPERITHQERFQTLKEITYQDTAFDLLLRPLEEKDAEAIHTARLSSLPNLLPFMEWAHHETSIEKQIERIQKSKEISATNNQYLLSLWDQNSDEFLMAIDLRGSSTLNLNALVIGFWVSSIHTNKGFATLCTKMAVVTAFDFLGCDRVAIGCNKANAKSKRVIEKCGFKKEAEARNYFTKPSQKMLQNGYHPERNCLQYSLILEDLPTLSWYDEIKDKVEITLK